MVAAANSSTRQQSCHIVGIWGDRGSVYRSVPVTARQYDHPALANRSSKRFRRGLWLALACLCVAGIGAAAMAPSWVRESDAAVAGVDQVSNAEAMSLLRSADGHPVSENGAQVVANKPSCLGARRPDGSCISFQLPKVRMVRVTKLPAATGQHGNSGKSGLAAAPSATKMDKAIAEPKKAQRTAHRQSQRRNHQPSARGYAPRERGYDGHQGFAGNFW